MNKARFKKGDIVFLINGFKVNHDLITCQVFTIDKQMVMQVLRYKDTKAICYRLSSKTKKGRIINEKDLFTKEEVLEKTLEWCESDNLLKLLEENKDE